MNKPLIKDIIEPTSLALVWKDINGEGNERRKNHTVAIIRQDVLEYLPSTLTLKETCGFHGYPAFPLNEERMEYKNPIPLFVKRCPPRNRQGFQEYLKDFGLNLTQEKASSLSDMALLAYTGGMLPTDSFSFLNTFEGVDSAFQFIMRVAGTQYHTEGIEVGSSLKIEFEPANQIDSNAILFKYQNQNAGYVPRPLQNSFKTWLLENRVDSSIVFKWNGTPEHPVLYAYISIQAKP